jgi:hypothetical protein
MSLEQMKPAVTSQGLVKLNCSDSWPPGLRTCKTTVWPLAMTLPAFLATMLVVGFAGSLAVFFCLTAQF